MSLEGLKGVGFREQSRVRSILAQAYADSEYARVHGCLVQGAVKGLGSSPCWRRLKQRVSLQRFKDSTRSYIHASSMHACEGSPDLKSHAHDYTACALFKSQCMP